MEKLYNTRKHKGQIKFSYSLRFHNSLLPQTLRFTANMSYRFQGFYYICMYVKMYVI